jgi:hypothetical protein
MSVLINDDTVSVYRHKNSVINRCGYHDIRPKLIQLGGLFEVRQKNTTLTVWFWPRLIADIRLFQIQKQFPICLGRSKRFNLSF